MSNKENSIGFSIKIGLAGGFLTILLAWLIFYFAMPVLKLNFLFHLVMFIAVVISIIIIVTSVLNESESLLKKGITSCVFFIVLWIVFSVGCSPMFASYKYREIGGEVKTEDFKKNVSEVELKNIPIIDEGYARKVADKKIGEIPGLGSKTDLGEMTMQLVKDKLYYIAPLEPSGFFPWLKNKGTEGYIMVDAMELNDVKLVTEVNGKPLKIRYSEKAYFGNDIGRHAYFSKMTIGFMDYSFEIDDEGNPYWVITAYDKAIGISGKKVVGALIVDAQSGQETYYEDINKIPSWVDRVQPMELMGQQFDWWGEYVHGFWNFSNTDKITTTKGMGVIYIKGQCYYYSGVTSTGADNSSTGFILINSRTGEKTFFKNSGATEQAGMKSAEGKVQNLKYTASFPLLINVNNKPTYFTPLKDGEGLIKQYAMVNVENYNIVGVGNNIEETYNNYVTALNNGSGNTTDVANNGTTKEETLTIDRMGNVMSQNELVFYITTVEQPDRLFIVSQGLSKEISLSKPNDKIKVSYIPNEKSNSINVLKYDNLNINLK